MSGFLSSSSLVYGTPCLQMSYQSHLTQFQSLTSKGLTYTHPTLHNLLTKWTNKFQKHFSFEEEEKNYIHSTTCIVKIYSLYWFWPKHEYKPALYMNTSSILTSPCASKVVWKFYTFMIYSIRFKGTMSHLEPTSNSVELCRNYEYVTYVSSVKCNR